MRKTILISALAIGSLLLTSNVLAGQWVGARRGFIPGTAWFLGRDTDGTRLALCRARYAGGIHPGKIRQGFVGCHISYAGREIVKRRYQVYIDRYRRRPRGFWARARRGNVPARAWPVGYDSNGSTLYLCRVRYNGVQPGKVNRKIGGCDIAYGGREVHLNRYHVFVKRW